jgi:hypothetical protein
VRLELLASFIRKAKDLGIIGKKDLEEKLILTLFQTTVMLALARPDNL